MATAKTVKAPATERNLSDRLLMLMSMIAPAFQSKDFDEMVAIREAIVYLRKITAEITKSFDDSVSACKSFDADTLIRTLVVDGNKVEQRIEWIIDRTPKNGKAATVKVAPTVPTAFGRL